jgi:hypothetical protein
MKIETVNAASLQSKKRLDSKYFLSPGIQAAERIARAKAKGIPSAVLGGPNGFASLWQPTRFNKVEAGPSEASVAYLRPYDVFEYLPRPTDYLSITRTRDIERSRLKRGMLLQSCSGRNLGPAVFVDDYLAQFVIGGDMIRIEIADPDLCIYTLAYMQSETGQQLLTQGKTGSVIDHLSKTHIGNMEIPLIESESRSRVVAKMKAAIELREDARLSLTRSLSEFEQQLPKAWRPANEEKGWTVRAKDFTGRLDAASYDPLVGRLRKHLTNLGGQTVDSVATVIKPGGRFKTVYVEKGNGTPILSGTQLLQLRPINLRYMPERAFKDSEISKLRTNWIAYQADGRVEDALGLPAMITSDRDGWLASAHVGRVIPNSEADVGWLFLALRSWTSQIQLKSMASGSVVDSTFPGDMEAVLIPPKNHGNAEHIPALWEKFAEAQRLENEALALVEDALAFEPIPELERDFRSLVTQWKSGRRDISTFTKMTAHPAYQKIIKMGKAATPLILQELEKEPDYWFGALTEIEGIDPIAVKSRGKMNEMTEAWLTWAKKKRLIHK